MSPLSIGTSRSTHALETGEAKLWSLLVGVNQYWDEQLPSLRYSAFDCQGLAEALAEATQGFPRKEAIVHHDFVAHAPTLEAVRASLKKIVAAAKPQDTILLYFSGHGVLDRHSQQVVLCLADTCKDDLLHTGLRVPEILDLLAQSRVHRQMLWLDACHSGDMTLRGAKGEAAAETPVLNPANQLVNVLRQRAAQSKGFYALLSCDQKQRSWEFPELKHGLFTYYLMQGLRGEAADPQGVIEADGLYKYVYHQTLQYIEKTNQQLRLMNQQKRSRGETDLHPEYPLQTPKRIVEGVGELVLGLRTHHTTPTENRQRRAILIDGLANSKTTPALSKVLHEAGKFELECWPQTGKAWTEVRNAIQSCLRSPAGNIQASEFSPHSQSSKETTTVLLYLRGKIEQIEDGEAWIVLGDNVRLSRSWLQQELRRAETAQQVVVLDCPVETHYGTSLQDWIEELKLNLEHGQCLIAASTPAQEPEQFTQALLETLVTANSQVNLTAASWISELQEKLEHKGIPLHAWLTGTQGVIEILPKSSSSIANVVNSVQPAAVRKEDAIESAPVEVQASPSFGTTLPTAHHAVSLLPAESFPQQYSQLEQFLREIVGPLAPALLKKIAKPNSHPQTWVDNLMQLLPPRQQGELKQRAATLLQTSTAQPQTRSTHAPSLKPAAIPESFVHECEEALVNYIGPIATVLIKKTLKSQSHASPKQLVEILAAQIPDRQKATEFRQRLLRSCL